MEKNKKKKNWTFLQIQLPRHHLIQSGAFAFCLRAVFREPVNKAGRINLMWFHVQSRADVRHLLFQELEFSKPTYEGGSSRSPRPALG